MAASSQLSPEEEKSLALERIKIYSDSLNFAVRERYKTLSTIASLATMLLIVATFGGKIIDIEDSLVKILLAILLLLIPSSLLCWFIELKNVEEYSAKMIKKIPEDPRAEIERKKSSILAYLPWVFSIILSLVIIIFILLIFDVPIKDCLLNLWKLFF